MWRKLGDKELVVNFQKFCGLRWVAKANYQSTDNMNKAEMEEPERKLDKCSRNCNIEKTDIENLDFKYNSLLHILFYLSSTLGDEQVLIAVLSFVLWNIDVKAVIRVYLSLAISLYFGQAAKDTFLEPRPPSPPVIRVERKYAEEYTMPSTHAMIGLVVPFSLVYYTCEHFEVCISQACPARFHT